MAAFRFWAIQNSQRADARARARLRVVRCGSKRVRRDPMLTWKSHRSPLREHFSFQANMATFLLWTIQRARACALCAAPIDGCGRMPKGGGRVEEGRGWRKGKREGAAPWEAPPAPAARTNAAAGGGGRPGDGGTATTTTTTPSHHHPHLRAQVAQGSARPGFREESGRGDGGARSAASLSSPSSSSPSPPPPSPSRFFAT